MIRKTLRKEFFVGLALVGASVMLAGCFGDVGGGSSELAELEEKNEALRLEISGLEKTKRELRSKVLSKEKQIRAQKKAERPSSSSSPKTSKPVVSLEDFQATEEYVALLESHIGKVEEQIEIWQQPVWDSFEGLTFNGFELVDGTKAPLTIESISETGVRGNAAGHQKEFVWSEISERTKTGLLFREVK